MKTLLSLVCFLVVILTVAAPALASDPAGPAPVVVSDGAAAATAEAAHALAPALSVDDRTSIDGAVKVLKDAQVDLETAKLVAERAQVTGDRANIYLAAVRFKILAEHQLRPSEWDVRLVSIERDGKTAEEWAIVRNEPPPPK